MKKGGFSKIKWPLKNSDYMWLGEDIVENVEELISKTMVKIEESHSGANDRKYGILDDKYVTYHPNGCGLMFANGKLNLGINEAGTLIDKEYSSVKLSFLKRLAMVVQQCHRGGKNGRW